MARGASRVTVGVMGGPLLLRLRGSAGGSLSTGRGAEARGRGELEPLGLERAQPVEQLLLRARLCRRRAALALALAAAAALAVARRVDGRGAALL